VHEAEVPGFQHSYRFHLTDPVRFTRRIRVTMEHGHANHLSDDWSSTAYWYQRLPTRPFGILPVAQRLPLRPADPASPSPSAPGDDGQRAAREAARERWHTFAAERADFLRDRAADVPAAVRAATAQAADIWHRYRRR
jgi:D-arabinan exo alpha-(1,3)/(1,5)-arabinofuranosidase (non-reducing end)